MTSNHKAAEILTFSQRGLSGRHGEKKKILDPKIWTSILYANRNNHSPDLGARASETRSVVYLGGTRETWKGTRNTSR